jgi:Leucine-rich repeat (LRR) protein
LEIKKAIQELVACYNAPENQKIKIPEDVAETISKIFSDSVFKPTLAEEERRVVKSLNPEEQDAVARFRRASIVLKTLTASSLENILSFVGGVPSLVNKEFRAQEEPVYKKRLQKIKEDPFLSQFIPEHFQQTPPTGLSQIRECVKETERLRQESLDTSLIKMRRSIERHYKLQINIAGSSNKEIAQNIRAYLKNNPSACEQISRIHLYWENLKEIPPEIALFKNVEELNISHNLISFLPSEMQSLKELKTLYLTDNPLDKLPSWIISFVKLEELDASNCPLMFLPSKMNKLSLLRVLNISHTKLTQIPEEVFSLANLKELYIVDTMVESISSKISQMNKLEDLVLNANRLSSIPVHELRRLPNLKELYLRSNRLPPDVLASIHTELGEESESDFKRNSKGYLLFGSTIEDQNFPEEGQP